MAVSYTHLDVYKRQVLTSGSIIYESKVPEEIRMHVPRTDAKFYYSYDQLLDQVKSYIIQDCYSRRKTSVGVAEELGITQSKASRLIRKYCAKEE